MKEYIVNVQYRTNSGCNAVNVHVIAPDCTAALDIASNKVRTRRGVTRIDGASCIEASGL